MANTKQNGTKAWVIIYSEGVTKKNKVVSDNRLQLHLDKLDDLGIIVKSVMPVKG